MGETDKTSKVVTHTLVVFARTTDEWRKLPIGPNAFMDIRNTSSIAGPSCRHGGLAYYRFDTPVQTTALFSDCYFSYVSSYNAMHPLFKSPI